MDYEKELLHEQIDYLYNHLCCIEKRCNVCARLAKVKKILLRAWVERQYPVKKVRAKSVAA